MFGGMAYKYHSMHKGAFFTCTIYGNIMFFSSRMSTYRKCKFSKELSPHSLCTIVHYCANVCFKDGQFLIV